MIMAFWVYNRSNNPSTPLREIKAYTKSPITTVGTASRVFRQVIIKRLPGNDSNATMKPMANVLDAQGREDVAAYYASQEATIGEALFLN